MMLTNVVHHSFGIVIELLVSLNDAVNEDDQNRLSCAVKAFSNATFASFKLRRKFLCDTIKSFEVAYEGARNDTAIPHLALNARKALKATFYEDENCLIHKEFEKSKRPTHVFEEHNAATAVSPLTSGSPSPRR